MTTTRQLRLADGREIHIRPAVPEEAGAVLAYLRQVGGKLLLTLSAVLLMMFGVLGILSIWQFYSWGSAWWQSFLPGYSTYRQQLR